MATMRINEGTTARVCVEFFDEDGVLTAPQSVEYRLDVKDNGQEILDWTPIAPAATIEILISDEENDSFIPTQALERHAVTVRATYDMTEQITGQYVYEVRNLRFLA